MDTNVERAQKPWILVTHDSPDPDAFACLWFAVRFVVGDAPYEIRSVRAGERLPDGECAGCHTLHMDTGRGQFDQHERELHRASSFKLLVEEYGYAEDPGIAPILAMTVAVDNVDQMAWTDASYVLKGLRFYYKDPESKQIDWDAAVIMANTLLNILYDQARSRARAAKEWEEIGSLITLPNGLKLAYLGFKPNLRGAAYEAGADVVVWMVPRSKRFYPIIQLGRGCSLKLNALVAEIRKAEATKRGISSRGYLGVIGSMPQFGGWVLHDSCRLILCGSRSHELTEETEFPTLKPHEILDITKRVMGGLTHNV